MFEFKSLYNSSGEEEDDNMETMFDCKDILNNNYLNSSSSITDSNGNSCSSGGSLSYYDDDALWKYNDYLLTPPQSPPMIPTFENYAEFTSDFDMAINSLPSSPIVDDDELLDDAANVAAINDVILSGGFSESILNELENMNSEQILTATSLKLNMELLHDCMWSGQCNVNCNSSRLNVCSNHNSLIPTANLIKRESNSINSCNTLGTSPSLSLISFPLNDMCANSCSTEGHLDDDEDDENNEQIDGFEGKKKRLVKEKKSIELDACDDYADEDDEENQGEVDRSEGYKRHVNRNCVRQVAAYDSGATLLASTNDSLKNDHSYGSPASSPRSIKKCKSLIYTTTKNCLKSKGLKVTTIKNNENNAHSMTIKFVNRQNLITPTKNDNINSSSAGDIRRCKLSQSKRSSSQSTCSSPSSTTSSISSSSSYSSTSSNNSQTSRTRNSKQVNNDYGPSILAKNSIMVNSLPQSPTSIQCSSLLSPPLSNASVSCSVRGSQSKANKSMYPERRREHNDSERKRRDHLRNAFHYLRDQIPKLKDAQKKPARIVILGEATAFVRSLQEKQRYLDKMKDTEIRKRDKLLKRLNALNEKHHI